MLKWNDKDKNFHLLSDFGGGKMYSQFKVHVPEKYHERIKNAITQDRPLAVKLNLENEANATLLLTPGQLIKIKRAMNVGKKVLTIRMSQKQAKANIEFEGGFLGMLMKLATKALPTLLGGLATGLISSGVEKAVSGNGLFLGKRGYGTARIDFTDGNGIVLTPVEADKYNGLYLKQDGQIYQGKGLLLGPNSPFKNIPILGLIL